MANALYGLAKEKILNGDIDFDTDVIKARLVDNSYAQNLTTDNFMDDVPKVNGTTDQTLSGVTITLGVFDANDVTWTAVETAHTAEAVVLFKFVTNDADSIPLAYIDTITGFPLATNGGNVTIQWDNGSYKIFSL